MAAQGQTNTDIAQQLFLTAKTVENHLGHIYRKLDIHSRTQISAALTTTNHPTHNPEPTAHPR
jgi:DNA-binding NarL/FixJ family response regulator